MSPITTHVLDTSLGKPAAGVPVVLERSGGPGGWVLVGSGETDADGRLRTLVDGDTPLVPGTYRLVFDSRKYFERRHVSGFYPSIVVIFEIGSEPHYHVPLLLSPFGYSTYRGS